MCLHSSKTNFYKEIRAGSDDHSYREPFSKESQRVR